MVVLVNIGNDTLMFMEFDGAEERLDTDRTISETCGLCVKALPLEVTKINPK